MEYTKVGTINVGNETQGFLISTSTAKHLDFKLGANKEVCSYCPNFISKDMSDCRFSCKKKKGKRKPSYKVGINNTMFGDIEETALMVEGSCLPKDCGFIVEHVIFNEKKEKK